MRIHPAKEKPMTFRRNTYSLLIASTSLLALALASCSSEEKPKPEAVKTSRVVNVEPGVAGGTIEETTTATVKVKTINHSTRRVTLMDDAGEEATFTADPEIRNLDQLHPGDKLTATLKERLVVYVRSAPAASAANGDYGATTAEKASDTYAAALARAPRGAKPGGVFAESYEVVALVTAIDSAARTADLKCADGWTHTVKVRPDVDLNRYKVGDSLVIRVTSSLGVLAATP
jgi:hypothetical protein